MKKTMLFTVLFSLLAGCVQVPAPPVVDNTAPTIVLESTTVRAYPGTTFQVDASIDDAESETTALAVSWEIISGDVDVTEQSNEFARFSIGL